MRKQLKQWVVFALTVTLCLTGIATALGERIFGDVFVASCNLEPADTMRGLSLTAMGDTAYLLLESGGIYVWNAEMDRYAFYAQVPVVPIQEVNVEIPFAGQSESIQHDLMESVDCLIPSEIGLYGLNSMSGSVGPIDGDGWHPNEAHLDMAAVRLANDDYSYDLRNAFIKNGKLYAGHDQNLMMPATPDTSLLVIDLASGECVATQLPNTIAFCWYGDGSLLCVQDDGTESPVFSVYDLGSQSFSAMDVAFPYTIKRALFAKAWSIHAQIGGLAYDAVRDTIYFANEQGLWQSVNGVPFELIKAQDTWATTEEPATVATGAWVLTSGGYITQHGWPYYVMP